jgi:hypothetical protein
MVRSLNPNHAFIVIGLANALAFGAVFLDLQYLKDHRPPAADTTRGFVIRQNAGESGQIYISTRDQAIHYGLVALDVAVFAASGGIAYRYARVRNP